MGCSMSRTSALACVAQTMRLPIAVGCFFRQRLPTHLVPIVHGQAELRQDFLMRNHGFHHMNHGGERAGAELVEQVMGVLYVSGHCVLPWSRSCARRRRRL